MTSWFARAVRGLLAILAEQIPSSANDQNNSIVKERAPRSVTGDVKKLRTQAGPGGARRDRTADLLLAKQALSRLSYGPCLSSVRQLIWWVWVDLNHRPHPYQGCALTS